MLRCAVSAIGRDRPGIVAALTRVLLDFGGNIEDSQMSILRGHFAVMLIVALPEADGEPEPASAKVEELGRRLDEVKRRLDLEAIAVSPVDDLAGTAPEPSHIITLYGADHPGIVHSAAAVLAEREISITGLETKLTGEPAAALYVMLIEIAAGEADIAELEAAMTAAGKEAGLEFHLRELDRTPL